MTYMVWKHAIWCSDCVGTGGAKRIILLYWLIFNHVSANDTAI